MAEKEKLTPGTLTWEEALRLTQKDLFQVAVPHVGNYPGRLYAGGRVEAERLYLVSGCDMQSFGHHGIAVMKAMKGEGNPLWRYGTACATHAGSRGVFLRMEKGDYQGNWMLSRFVCEAWVGEHPREFEEFRKRFLDNNYQEPQWDGRDRAAEDRIM